jgi:hypothetical protein
VGAAETFGGFQQDRFYDAVGILINIAVPKSNNGPTFGLEELRPHGIAWRAVMLRTVDFDDQPRLSASKIGCLGADRKLACELWAIAGEKTPKGSFLIGRIGPKRTSSRGLMFRNAAMHGGMVAEWRYAPTHPYPSLAGRGFRSAQ